MYLPRFAYEANAALSDVEVRICPGPYGGHIMAPVQMAAIALLLLLLSWPPVVKYAFELGFTH